MKEKTPDILVINSEISELKKIEEFLLKIFESNKLPQKCFNKVFLCVSEAVSNSIIHGNKDDKNKFVTIELNCLNKEISVQIEDEGEGFNIENVKDPTIRDNLKVESGRGIYIIKTLTDSLEYNDRGNRIRFKIDCCE